jgi:hypothetical protein
MVKKKNLKFFEDLVYVLACFLTFGVPWILKITIKKAILQTQEK